MDKPDLAEIARTDHLAHPAHERIASVIVGQREHEARLFHRVAHLFRFREAHRQRLVTDDMDSGLEERIGRPGMDVIRGNNGDRLDPVGPLGFSFRHARVIIVDPVGGET